ncbi:MAG TPA: hypothetical protein VG839_06770 [Asticcacaulis sp.]|nr:hypothetical protein [Asticcacaulis sp.]
MRTGLKTIGLALAMVMETAGIAHGQDTKNTPQADMELASTALECVAVFDIVAPQFPDRAAEIRDYRAKAVAQFLRASQTKEADFPGYLADMRQKVDAAVKDGQLRLMAEVNDCAQIYAP